MNMKCMLVLDVCIPGCLAKCETEYCMLQIINCEWTTKHYQRGGRAQAEHPDPAHCPQKTAVPCTCVVPVWSGNELLRAQLPPSSQLYCPAEVL